MVNNIFLRDHSSEAVLRITHIQEAPFLRNNFEFVALFQFAAQVYGKQHIAIQLLRSKTKLIVIFPCGARYALTG